MTTLEVHNATNLKLRLDDSTEQQEDQAASSTGIKRAAAYGTVTLDPHLDNVSLDFEKPSVIGSVIVTSPTSAAKERTLRQVSLSIGDEHIHHVQDSLDPCAQTGQDGQTHLYFDEGAWHTKGLTRREKDYPSLTR